MFVFCRIFGVEDMNRDGVSDVITTEQAPEPNSQLRYILLSGRTGRTLVKVGALRLTLTLIAEGVEIGTHQAASPMTLQPLEGRLRYRVGDAEFEIGQRCIMSEDGIVFHEHGDRLTARHGLIFDHE